jgi:hypothetical protein
MEPGPTEVSDQEILEDYEQFIGPPKDFPYMQYVEYQCPKKGILCLDKDKLFSFNYDMSDKENGESQTIVVNKGHYEVDLDQKLLILNVESVHLSSDWSFVEKYKSDSGKKELDKIQKVLSENIKKIEVKNFKWLSMTLSITRLTVIPEGNLESFSSYNFANYEYQLKNDHIDFLKGKFAQHIGGGLTSK